MHLVPGVVAFRTPPAKRRSDEDQGTRRRRCHPPHGHRRRRAGHTGTGGVADRRSGTRGQVRRPLARYAGPSRRVLSAAVQSLLRHGGRRPRAGGRRRRPEPVPGRHHLPARPRRQLRRRRRQRRPGLVGPRHHGRRRRRSEPEQLQWPGPGGDAEGDARQAGPRAVRQQRPELRRRHPPVPGSDGSRRCGGDRRPRRAVAADPTVSGQGMAGLSVGHQRALPADRPDQLQR